MGRRARLVDEAAGQYTMCLIAEILMIVRPVKFVPLCPRRGRMFIVMWHCLYPAPQPGRDVLGAPLGHIAPRWGALPSERPSATNICPLRGQNQVAGTCAIKH